MGGWAVQGVQYHFATTKNMLGVPSTMARNDCVTHAMLDTQVHTISGKAFHHRHHSHQATTTNIHCLNQERQLAWSMSPVHHREACNCSTWIRIPWESESGPTYICDWRLATPVCPVASWLLAPVSHLHNHLTPRRIRSRSRSNHLHGGGLDHDGIPMFSKL